MKELIYETEKTKTPFFKLCDEITNTQGQSCKRSDYVISKNNMPHKYFKDNIVIYGRKTCPYCQDALNHLKNKTKYDNKVIFIVLDTEPAEYFAKNNLLQILKNEIGDHKTVTMTFYKGKFIGGCDDTKEYFKA